MTPNIRIQCVRVLRLKQTILTRFYGKKKQSSWHPPQPIIAIRYSVEEKNLIPNFEEQAAGDFC
jgi:hypothetical protein